MRDASTHRSSLTAAFMAAVTALALSLGFGCAARPDPAERPPLALPDQAQFTQPKGVNDFLVQRCAGLDCHGQIGRPLRLYSPNGLRFEDGPGGARNTGAMSDKEKIENYISVVGLEPEGISEVVASGGEFTDLLLFKKPLGIDGGGVRHKGGTVIRVGDDGWRCFTSWASGAENFDAKACEDAVGK